MAVLPPEMTVKIPLSIERVDTSDKAKSDGSTAVIKETAVAQGPAGKVFLSYTKYFAIDRATAQNVASKEADVKNRKGYSIALGFSVDEKKAYPYWDDDTATVTNLRFVKTVSKNGIDYNNVPLLMFKASSEAKMVTPPLGLPSQIPGSGIKSILGNQNLPFGDTQNYPIDYVKFVDATLLIDQKEGSIVDVNSYQETYSVDATALGMGKIKIGSLTYSQTPENVAKAIDDVVKTYPLLNAVQIYIPVILLGIGLIILVIGFFLFFRKKQRT
jgi:hypothetical protein